MVASRHEGVEVVNQVDCSVLTLKPEGFVTPVTLE